MGVDNKFHWIHFIDYLVMAEYAYFNLIQGKYMQHKYYWCHLDDTLFAEPCKFH